MYTAISVGRSSTMKQEAPLSKNIKWRSYIHVQSCSPWAGNNQ